MTTLSDSPMLVKSLYSTRIGGNPKWTRQPQEPSTSVRSRSTSSSTPTIPAAASPCSSAWSQPMRRCPFLTATTRSRRRSTVSRESLPGRSTARPVNSPPAISVCIRRGQVHGFENHGSVDAKFLAIATPGVFGPAYFRDIAQVRRGGGRPARSGRDRRSDAPPRADTRPTGRGLTVQTIRPDRAAGAAQGKETLAITLAW